MRKNKFYTETTDYPTDGEPCKFTTFQYSAGNYHIEARLQPDSASFPTLQ